MVLCKTCKNKKVKIKVSPAVLNNATSYIESEDELGIIHASRIDSLLREKVYKEAVVSPTTELKISLTPEEIKYLNDLADNCDDLGCITPRHKSDWFYVELQLAEQVSGKQILPKEDKD